MKGSTEVRNKRSCVKGREDRQPGPAPRERGSQVLAERDALTEDKRAKNGNIVQKFASMPADSCSRLIRSKECILSTKAKYIDADVTRTQRQIVCFSSTRHRSCLRTASSRGG
jgi:hypothetical protein